MRSELQTLFWLQWKLTRSMFRGRRVADRLRLLMLLSRLAMFLFSIPTSVLIGCGLAVGMILLSPEAAHELATLTNVCIFFIWLSLPASYNSQLAERFEMSRLFAYPIRFRSIVVGSTLMSLLTITGMWTALILLGEIVGMAWHRPLALPLILIGALPTFALLVLTGRIIGDFFDLVAGDRRLRTLVLSLFSLPFVLCWLGQYAIQYAADSFSRPPWFARIPFLQGLESLSQADSPTEFLETLRASRLLIWLPPGWATAGMGLALRGEWGRQLALVALSTAFVALLFWAHAGITRRLMQGAALSIGTERVRARRRWPRLPGPPAFWALFHKDWTYLWRSPMPRRLIFSTLMAMVAMAIPLFSKAPSRLGEGPPLIVGAFAVTLVSMVVNMGLAANYFGVTDREGFATLAFSSVDRRQVILSANLTVLLFAGALYLAVTLGIALLTRRWTVLPLGLYLGLCMQIGGTPAYNLAAIIGPYRAQLRFGGDRQRANFWGILAWFLSALPVLALIVLPYLFWRPGLALTLPLGAIYCLGLYVFALKPLARLLQRREYAILEAVTTRD